MRQSKFWLRNVSTGILQTIANVNLLFCK